MSIPSLREQYGKCGSQGKQEIKTPAQSSNARTRVTTTPVTRTPISAAGYNKSVFSKEEEDKLRNLVTEHDFNMFMKAKEKAATMVVRVTFVLRGDFVVCYVTRAQNYNMCTPFGFGNIFNLFSFP